QEKQDPEEPILVGEVIPAEEIRAASTEDILGKSSALKSKKETDPKSEKEENQSPVVSNGEGTPIVAEAADNVPAAVIPMTPPSRPRLQPRKPKPVSVAATPKIGNYKLPPLELLQSPDLTVK